MNPKIQDPPKSSASEIFAYIGIIVGAFISAFAIKIFFLPNNLIDGGTVGLAMITARAFGSNLLPIFLLLFNLPFIYLAYRHLGKAFVVHVTAAVLAFAFFLFIMPYIFAHPFHGESLEVVVIGGAILGVGIGIIIRGWALPDRT